MKFKDEVFVAGGASNLQVSWVDYRIKFRQLNNVSLPHSKV